MFVVAAIIITAIAIGVRRALANMDSERGTF